MTSAQARETVESMRRRSLHSQIGALKARLEKLSTPPHAVDWLKRRKLVQKIGRLEAELLQPMLLPPKRRA